MTKSHITQFEAPVNEDGIYDHFRFLSNGPQELIVDGYVKCHKSVFNRVLVLTGDYQEVLQLRENMPKAFQEFDPVNIKDLVLDDWRPEPQRLVYGSPHDFSEAAIILGNYGFYSYSMILKVGNMWADARDATNTKWGRVCAGWHANPDTITSSDVLNGVRKL